MMHVMILAGLPVQTLPDAERRIDAVIALWRARIPAGYGRAGVLKEELRAMRM